MNTKIMIIDQDPTYLIDVKEFLDSVGKFDTDVSTLDEFSRKEYKEYDLVIANEKVASLIDNQNIIPMFPEYSSGKGYAKYSGKEALIECIDEFSNSLRKIKGRPVIINIVPLGDLKTCSKYLNKILKEVCEMDKKILFINLSYSLRMQAKTGMSSSELIFYLASKVEEKDILLKNILKSDKNYLLLSHMNSLQEIFELENGKLRTIYGQLKRISVYDYIYIVLEPGIRGCINEYLVGADLNVLMLDENKHILNEINKISNQNEVKILPMCSDINQLENITSGKGSLRGFSYLGTSRFTRRIDEIFSRDEHIS